MAPTTPITGRRALYAKNPTTGDVYQIAISSDINSIDDLSDVDTSTTGPTGGSALIWDETAGQWVPGIASTVASLDDLTDVTTVGTGATGPSGPTDGQVLLWDEALGQWIPGAQANSIDDLTDVDTGTTGPTGGQVLVWDETLNQWVPGSQANSIDDLTDVDTGTTGPTGGQVLVWDETISQWVPGSQASSIDDLTDVDTGTTGPVDKDALVWSASGNQWVPGARSIDDLWDVNTTVNGPTGPTGPAHGQMLAWDGTLNQWVPGPAASEVELGPTMPTGAWELWMDTAIALSPPGGGGATGGAAVDDYLLKAGGEMSGGITFTGAEGITFNSQAGVTFTAQDSGLMFPGGSSIVENVATSTLILRRSSSGGQPQIGNLDGSSTFNILDRRPTVEVATPGNIPWFDTSDIKLRYNDLVCTWYGRVNVDTTAPAPTALVAAWPAGIGFPGRISAPIDVFQGSGDNLQYFEAAQVFLDPYGLGVLCYAGFTLPNGRSFDFSITWTR